MYLCPMLKEYTIANILQTHQGDIPYYVGTFEGTDDPDIEWPHRHAFYSLVWFTEGNGFYVVDFQEYEIRKDRIFSVSPRQVHNWDYSENSRGYVLMIDLAFARQLQLEPLYPYVDITTQAPFLQQIFGNLLDESTRQDALSTKTIQSAISYLYSLLARIADNNPNPYPAVNETIEALRKLIYENNTLQKVEDYARKMNLPEDTFNTMVKTFTGISAKQYILDLKITEAKRQLIYSQFNINEIAFNLGFEDPSYFTRLFKKKTGLSPSAFLKKYRKHL